MLVYRRVIQVLAVRLTVNIPIAKGRRKFPNCPLLPLLNGLTCEGNAEVVAGRVARTLGAVLL